MNTSYDNHRIRPRKTTCMICGVVYSRSQSTLEFPLSQFPLQSWTPLLTSYTSTFHLIDPSLLFRILIPRILQQSCIQVSRSQYLKARFGGRSSRRRFDLKFATFECSRDRTTAPRCILRRSVSDPDVTPPKPKPFLLSILRHLCCGGAYFPVGSTSDGLIDDSSAPHHHMILTRGLGYVPCLAMDTAFGQIAPCRTLSAVDTHERWKYLGKTLLLSP